MIKHIEETNSTSKYMMGHPRQFDNMDVLSASHQTEGVGRTGHKWIDNKNENALFSVMIKDKEIIDSYKTLSISIGVIVLNYLKRYFKEESITLKWPNDVYVNNKKICGILLQGRLPEYVVVGIGLNINQRWFYRLGVTPTSLSLELDQKFDLIKVREALINYVIKSLSNFGKIKKSSIEEFNNHNYLKNKAITYFDNRTNRDEEGVALDINDEGELLIQTGGQIISVSSSEISEIR